MSRNIRIERIEQKPIEQQQIEPVKRKRIGYPDSIAGESPHKRRS